MTNNVEPAGAGGADTTTEETIYQHVVRSVYALSRDDKDRMARAGWEFTHYVGWEHHFRRPLAGAALTEARAASTNSETKLLSEAAYVAMMAETEARAQNAVDAREAARSHTKLQAQGKVATPGLICPHCGESGHVTSKQSKEKEGISGAKATAALLTGGVSLLVPGIGLSRKVNALVRHCTKCGSRWTVR
jgi:hypothetical protein